MARAKPLNVIEFGKLPVIAVGLIPNKFLFGLFIQVFRIYQKQYAFGIRVLQQLVHKDAGSKRIIRSGSHMTLSQLRQKHERFSYFYPSIPLK